MGSKSFHSLDIKICMAIPYMLLLSSKYSCFCIIGTEKSVFMVLNINFI